MKQVEIDFDYLNTLSTVLSKVTFSGGMHHYPKCAIAGGAIRDMLLQKPVSDIDVFYVGELFDKQLNMYFKQVKSTNAFYPDGFNVTHTVSLTALPVPIQLIQVKDIKKHIETFPTPMSRVSFWYDEGLQGVDVQFVADTVAKEFVWDKKVDMPYFDKIKAKYSDWKHVFTSPEYDPYHENVEEELDF